LATKLQMFKLARIKLTAWYLIIIMLISLSFSAVIYQGTVAELNRIEAMQRFRRPIPNPILHGIEPEIIEETKHRVAFGLTLINLVILGISGAAGYFLAGKTLKPIKEMVEEQSRFVSDASHELRTPITSLKSEIEVSLRDKKLTLADAKKVLVSNLEEVNSLQNLSDKLIKMARFQKGENNFSPTQVSLAEITKEAVAKISPLARQKKIRIVNSVKPIKIQAEKESLVELCVIFLENAVKYSPMGKEIEVESVASDGHVTLKFIDHGIGIAKEDLSHIFDRFYRSDKSRTKENIPGYGLGLAIAKQIIDRHSGSVKVKSEPGRQTVFWVTLPKNQPTLSNYV